MPETTVVIVGGGAAGLSAAGALRRAGIEAVVLDQDAEIGGTWARRYDRLHLHTVRPLSGLAHWPIPDRYPTYLSRNDVVAYLRAYAQHFQIAVQTGQRVRRVEAIDRAAAWSVVTDRETWRARVVVIATGQYRQPVTPAWPGLELFKGRLLHSHDYRNAAPFVGQRVLVVGVGNSGAEIATDLAKGGAASVAVSVRTPPVIVPRDPFGLPVQRTSVLLSHLPAFVANRMGRATSRLALGNLSRYGLSQRVFAPYTTKHVPLIDVGFVDALKRGLVSLRPAVTRLTTAGAMFGGEERRYDAIVAATGFKTGLESLIAARDVLDDRGEPLGVSGEPTSQPGLYFMGFVHSLRGHLFEANLASRRLAKRVQKYLQVSKESSH
jgi:cation diffusion facilitator CzcD-associated flavoprotein CzcO